MNFKNLMTRALELGMAADYRGTKRSMECCAMAAERIARQKINNRHTARQIIKEWPVYVDTVHNYGGLQTPVRKIMVGIDMPPASVVQAKELNEKGWGIDLLFVHHTVAFDQRLPWRLLPFFWPSLLELDASSLATYFDIPQVVARKLAGMSHRAMEQRRREKPPLRRPSFTVEQAFSCKLAKTFDLPLFSCHTPCDNLLQQSIREILDGAPRTAGEMIEATLAIPEYARFRRERFKAPEIIVGRLQNKLGKVWAACTLTLSRCLNEEFIKELRAAGFSSIIGILQGRQEVYQAAAKYGMNVIILPHDPSDCLGINRMFDGIAKGEKIDVLCTGDFFRSDITTGSNRN